MSVSQVEYLAEMNARPEVGLMEIGPEDNVRVLRWRTEQFEFVIRITNATLVWQKNAIGPNAIAAVGLPATRKARHRALVQQAAAQGGG